MKNGITKEEKEKAKTYGSKRITWEFNPFERVVPNKKRTSKEKEMEREKKEWK